MRRCADGFCNLLDSCGAVWDRILGAGPSDADLLGAVILMVISLAARVFFIATLFWTLTGTAHFRLGRYADLYTDFGGTFIVSFLSFAVALIVRVLRMIRAPMAQSVGPAASSFYTSAGMGMVYSALVVFPLLFSAIWYVQSIAALRRVSASKYYMHPEAFYHARRPRC